MKDHFAEERTATEVTETLTMAFFLGAAGKGAAASLGLGPFALVGVGSALVLYTAYKLVERQNRDFVYEFANSRKSTPVKVPIREKQEKGDMDSSEVEDHLHLGKADLYKNIKRYERPFSQGKDGEKGYVEADHIPPLDSLRRAEHQPGFSQLRHRNRGLYDMVLSLRNDPRGENLLAIQVSTHHHRDALSTGASAASSAARLLVARTIASGNGKLMLKQAMIIAHPYASQEIRYRAGIERRPPRRLILLSRGRTMDIYRNAFFQVVKYYYEKGIIDVQEYLDLMRYVQNDGYIDCDSEEFQEMLEFVKLHGRR